MISEAVSKPLPDTPVTNLFYGIIADEIAAHLNEFVLSGSLVVSLESVFAAVIPKSSEVTVEMFTASDEFRCALLGYEGQICSNLALFDTLQNVAGSAGVIRTALAEICAFGLDVLG